MKPSFLLVSALLLILSACSFSAGTLPAEEIAPTAENLPTPEQNPLPTPTLLTAGEMITYTDPFAGFSIDYPGGWYLQSSALANAEQSVAYSISFATWDTLIPPTPSGKGDNAMPEGGTKIDVGVMKQPMTLEEAVAQLSEVDSPVLARKDVTLAGGLQGVILEFEGFAGLTRTMVTVLNGNVIYVSGYGNLEQFESIALTLRAN